MNIQPAIIIVDDLKEPVKDKVFVYKKLPEIPKYFEDVKPSKRSFDFKVKHKKKRS